MRLRRPGEYRTGRDFSPPASDFSPPAVASIASVMPPLTPVNIFRFHFEGGVVAPYRPINGAYLASIQLHDTQNGKVTGYIHTPHTRPSRGHCIPLRLHAVL